MLQSQNYALINLTTIEGKRESRRLIGDYIINQNDTQQAVPFPDRIAYGGWPLDIHHPEGIFSGKEGPFDFDLQVPLWTIPFRSLYSKNIDNLLFAARNMSVTHTALGSVRVQATLAVCGQAAGTAAGLCIKYNTTPREIYKRHIKELQQILLKDDAYIIGMKNEDPLDLARRAKPTASSTKKIEEFKKEDVKKTKRIHPLDMPRAIMFPVEKNKLIKSISLLLISKREGPVEITLELRESSQSENFSSTDDIITSEVTIAKRGEQWVKFPLNCKLKESYAWVCLSRIEGISWILMEGAPGDSRRAHRTTDKGPWTVSAGQCYTFFLNPSFTKIVDCGVEGIISGVTRPEGDKINMWISDPIREMPQWVELDFGKPAKLNTVYLTFDTDSNQHCSTNYRVARVPECVKDYELFYYDEKEWISLEKVKSNYQRRRAHHFKPITTSKLKLEIRATNGDKSARIHEIRVYNE